MEKKKRETRSYSEEYKVEAVKLAREIGNSKAAAELGVPSGTVSGWVHEAKKGRIDTGAGTQTPATAQTQAAEVKKLREEVKALAKDNERLREEREILEDACAFFAESRRKFKQKSDSSI